MSAPKVKICGLSQLDDVAAVNACAPDYVGLVFWPRSKRCVSADEAACLRAALDAHIAAVGVFVNADINAIARLHERGVIAVAQLHGDEDDAYIERLRTRAPDLAVWKAFEVHARATVERANASAADLVLLDAGKGEGRAFDWSVLAACRRPFALAGGLGPSNVAAALRQCSPSVVDVSSGVEGAAHATDGRPRKDAALMSAFARAVRAAGDSSTA